MYKKRLRAWGQRKYYSKDQKEEIIRLQDTNHQTSRQNGNTRTGPIFLNNKELRQHRIERYRRRQLNQRAFQRCQSRVEMVQLQHSPDYRRIEICLSEANCYFNQISVQTHHNEELWHISNTSLDFDDLIYSAQQSFRHNKSESFAYLNRAFSLLPILLRDGRPHFLLQSLNLSRSSTKWAGMEEVRLSLLRFIDSGARKVLGQLHPISRFCHMSLDLVDYGSLIGKLGGLMIEKSREAFQSASVEEKLYFQLQVLSVSIAAGEIQDSEMAILKILKDAEKHAPGARKMINYANCFMCVAFTGILVSLPRLNKNY